MKNVEQIVHPSHYNWLSGVECMDVVKHFTFTLGNVIKYIWRAGHKSSTTKMADLLKARYYLDIAIEQERENAKK